MEQRQGKLQNQCCPYLMPLRCGSQNIENIMDGKDYQRGSIEKDGNRQINSETIQDEQVTICQYLVHLIRHDTSHLQIIEGKIKDRRSWPTKNYLDN